LWNLAAQESAFLLMSWKAHFSKSSLLFGSLVSLRFIVCALLVGSISLVTICRLLAF
jgi:hypothetical protein